MKIGVEGEVAEFRESPRALEATVEKSISLGTSALAKAQTCAVPVV